jgi:hypothetical protein
LRLDMSKLLSMVSAQQRAAPTQAPRSANGAGGARGASRSGSAFRDHHACSVYEKSRVQNGVGPSEFEWPSLMRSMLTMLSPFAQKNSLLKSWPKLQIRALQLEREGSPPPGCAYLRQSCHVIPIK